MSWPEYLPSFDELNDEANDIYTNNAPEDGDTEDNYFISDTSEFETDMVFNSRQQLIDWVQNTGRGLGYVIVIKRSNANLNIFFQCDRGGTYKSKKVSTKNTGTKKINCPFALKGKYSSIDNCWSLKSIFELHNHEPALYLEGHPYPRRLSESETRLVEDLLRKNVKPRDILSTLKKQNVENVSTLPTIYNARQKFKMKEYSGKTQMQVVMSFLDENGYIYYNHADTSTNELQDLFFAHQRSLEIWRAFPHVMLMDATYKTNRYEMPLLEIVGVTPTNLTFCIAFVYMHKETETNYTWALECLKSTMDRCVFPRVIVTDRELACMKACNNVFPNAKRLLCRWHINTSIKRKYKTLLSPHSWTPFYRGWKKLVESESEEAYIANLSQVEKLLVDYKGVITYLKKTWLTPYKEKFVSVWTDKFLHFGNHTTNRVESQHAKLKQYLDSSQSNLATILPKIHDVIRSQDYAIKSSLQQSKIISRHRFNHPIFENLVGHVSMHALEIMFKEFEQIKFLEICGCQMRTVRYDLMQEMMTHKLEYGQMFGIEECFNIYNTLDFFDTENGAPQEKWLDMPDMGVIVASKYNIVLHVLSMRGSSTYLPLRSPPIPWYERVVIAIAHVNGNHWVKVSLSGQYPVSTIATHWRHHRYECAAGWVTMYKNQLDDYDRYLAHCFGGTRDKVVLE